MLLKELVAPWRLVLRDKDDGGGGGAGDDDLSRQEGGSGGSPPTNPLLDAAGVGKEDDASKAGDEKVGEGKESDDPPVQGYRPEGLPERFAGGTDRETIDKLFGEVKDKPAPPDKPGGYELKLDPELAEVFGDMADDPVLPLWRETAHALDMSNEQFNQGMNLLFSKMNDAGLIDTPVNVEKELQALGSAGDPQQRMNEGKRAINEAARFLDGQVKRGGMTEGVRAQLLDMMRTADGVRAVQHVMKVSGETGYAAGGAPRTGVTTDELTGLMNDPRYAFDSPQYDPSFVAEVDKKYQQHYGS